MNSVPGTELIKPNGKGYSINRTEQGKFVYYGTYPTLIVALMVRDKFICCGWPEFHSKHKNNPGKFIYPHGNNFVVTHKICGITKHFGTFKSLSEAEKFRDYCVKYDWNIEPKRVVSRHYLPKYINKSPCGSYYIYKNLKDKTEHFGTFRTLDEAVSERNKLIECDWDYDLLVEMD